MADLIYKDEVFKIIGAAMEVYNELTHVLSEPFYQEAFAIEMTLRQIPHKEQCPVRIQYKGHILKKEYCPDYIAYDQIIIEIKALEKLSSREESQVLYYLHGSRLPLGLLINFGNPNGLEWKRFANTR